MAQPPPRQPKQSPLQWVHIDDFSPGCYDGSNIASEQPALSTVPLGAADLTQTYACSSIAGGALGPLPALTQQWNYSALGGGLPGASTYSVITAFIVVPQLNTGNYEVVIVTESDDGSNHFVKAFSFVPATTVVTGIAGPTNTSGSTGGGIFGAPYPAFTRMTSGGTGNPPPILIFPGAVATDANGVSGHLWVYPSLSSPTTFSAQDLVTAGSTNSGQMITYGNRVICMVGKTYSWPTGSGVNTNENFNYTDPPESSSYGNQQTIMGIEIPWGYGAWGTISVGELILIKKYGGAVILNGDINVPSSIIRMPGVQATGDIVGRAEATSIGLVYCSQDRGAWIWNGGNTANKISANIDDNFFDLELNRVGSSNYGFYCYQWQKWVMFSNNIVYDTTTGGWWKLQPSRGQAGAAGREIFWYSLTQNGNQMATAPLRLDSNSEVFMSVFDNRVPASSYQWTSLPIHVVNDADRVIDVRQVVIRASDPTNSGHAVLQVVIGSFNVNSTETIHATPTPIRLNVGGAGGTNLTYDIPFQIVCSNTSGNSAPIIHSIDIGYTVRASVGVNN
jgi:hypothetical protein